MNKTIEFVGFSKIARLSREMVITEKIDGTNGQIYIEEDGTFLVGSHTQWITPDKDNHGFARWTYDNKEELMKLGKGRHFGEWWGSGINRGYGLQKGEKRFSLFNVIRWCNYGTEPKQIPTGDPRLVKMQEVLPSIVSLVPELYRGLFDTNKAIEILEHLKNHGSYAVPGFMRPEGIVVYHIAGNVGFKKTVEKDDVPKSMRGE